MAVDLVEDAIHLGPKTGAIVDHGILKKQEGIMGGAIDNARRRIYYVSDPKGLDRAMEDINKLEKTRVEQDIYNQYNELFPWLLVPGLCLVAMGTGLNMVTARRII